MPVCLATDEVVMKFAGLLVGECNVVIDQQAGTVEAKDGEKVVYKAIRKGGPGSAWIVRYSDSERIKFKEPG